MVSAPVTSRPFASNASSSVLDVAEAQVVERLGALPGLDLAAVLGERHRVEEAVERGEHPAGFDLGELLGVADEHDLCARLLGGVEYRGELAGARHPRLVAL